MFFCAFTSPLASNYGAGGDFLVSILQSGLSLLHSQPELQSKGTQLQNDFRIAESRLTGLQA
jgi:hypothetical protein